MLNVARDVTRFIMEKFEIKSPTINKGYCYQWAWEFHKRVGGCLYTVKGLGGHAFVKKDGLFYDCQNPEGVRNWKKLAVWIGDNMKKIPTNYARRMSRHEFREYWIRNGGSNTHIDKI